VKIKEGADPVGASDDFLYMIENGYIKPIDFVSAEDAMSVEAAVEVITGFRQSMEDSDMLEEM